jgi:hypothetical protein
MFEREGKGDKLMAKELEGNWTFFEGIRNFSLNY